MRRSRPGNSVVLKPASQSPLTALRLAELAAEAGLPDGVLNVVTGPGGVIGDALARHPGVDKVAFTGSTEVGKSLLRAVGESDVKTISLELGGKSPNLVLADVGDLEQAASSIGWGIFYNSGQTCNAGSRLIVHRSVREELVERIAAMGRELAPGEPLDPATQLGSIVDQRQLDKVLGYVRLGADEGARVVSGGEQVRQETGGFYVEPTILDGVDERLARRARGDLRAGPDRHRVRGRGRRAARSPTTPRTGWRPASGPATSPGRTGCRGRSGPGSSG